MIRRTRWERLFFSSLAAMSLLLSMGQAAAAPPASSLTTSPVSVTMNVAPGTSQTTTLQVMNNNPQPVQLSLELDTFSANGTNGEASVRAVPVGDPVSSWVHFSQSTFVAQPGVWTPVQMTVDLPSSASLGYYLAVLFKPTIPTSSTPHTATIKGSNAILILVDTHSANEQRGLQVANFVTTKHLYEYLPATFKVTVRNNGNIFLAPIGDIFISKNSDFSHALDSLPVNAAAGNVLPSSVRIFTVNWTDGFPVFQPKTVDGQPLTKNGKPIQSLQWNFNQLGKFRFGKYYAHLALAYNNGHQDIPIDSVVSFWVIPWKLLIVAVLLIGIIVLGLFGFGRSLVQRLHRSKSKEAQK